MLIILTIFKIIVCLAGFSVTVYYLMPGLKGDKLKLKRAGLMFLCTWILIIFISAIEFAIIKL